MGVFLVGCDEDGAATEDAVAGEIGVFAHEDIKYGGFADAVSTDDADFFAIRNREIDFREEIFRAEGFFGDIYR